MRMQKERKFMISIQAVRRAMAGFKMSAELKKRIEEDRRRLVEAVLSMCRDKRK